MCFSPVASIWSFTTNIVFSILLLKYNPALTTWFSYVGLMQLYDFIFWKNQERTMTNMITTKAAAITVFLQPIVFAMSVVYISKQKLTVEAKAALVMYSIYTLIYAVIWWDQIDYTLVDKDGSLHWKWTNFHGAKGFTILYLVCLGIIAFQHFEWPINLVITILLYGTYGLSHFRYKSSDIGRLWCWIAGFVPLLIVVFYTMYHNVKLN